MKLSIIIPIYNESESLQELSNKIVNICHKTHVSEFEIIFVDDGSTDNTQSILRQLQKKN